MGMQKVHGLLEIEELGSQLDWDVALDAASGMASLSAGEWESSAKWDGLSVALMVEEDFRILVLWLVEESSQLALLMEFVVLWWDLQ